MILHGLGHQELGGQQKVLQHVEGNEEDGGLAQELPLAQGRRADVKGLVVARASK